MESQELTNFLLELNKTHFYGEVYEVRIYSSGPRQ